MQTRNSITKILMMIYLLFMMLHIFGHLFQSPGLKNTSLAVSGLTLCCVAFYALKSASASHRLLFWIALFIWIDFLCSLINILGWKKAVPVDSSLSTLFSLSYVLPSLILLILCLEILYLVRERLNTKFFFINLSGIALFFAVMVSGILSYRFSQEMLDSLSPAIAFSSVIDIFSLVLLISILSSLIHSRLHRNVFLILLGIALFCCVGISFLIIDILDVIPQVLFVWSLFSVTVPLFWIYVLLELSKCPSQLLSRSVHTESKRLQPVTITKTKIHTLLFVLSCLCLFLDLVNFSIFSYMNLALLLYFLVSNSYLIGYQNKQYVQEQRELNHGLEEKVKQRNVAILKQNIKLQDLANRDILTNAFNRRYFQEVIAELKEDATLYAVDILQFSNINQIFGEAIGDQVLIHLYKALHYAFPSQSIFRVDSNEYVILFRSLHKQAEQKKTLHDEFLKPLKCPLFPSFIRFHSIFVLALPITVPPLPRINRKRS